MKLSDLQNYNPIMIQCHDNPDADAIASAFALYLYFSELGKQVRMIYSGRLKVQKSNLTLFLKELHIPLEYVAEGTDLFHHEKSGLLLTTDCQYGAGNVTKFDAENIAIIDHHQVEITNIPLCEIRSNYGSCSTVVWHMMKEAGFDFSKKVELGTALYYGLFSDTNQFSEIRNPVDMDMRDSVDCMMQFISELKNCNISLKELEIAGIALIRYIFNDKHQYAIIRSQPCDPNVLGLISDLVLQVDQVKTCVVYNELEDGIKLSVRSCTKEVKASELAAYLTKDVGSGGGHLEKAGGFIPKGLYQKHYQTLHAEAFFSSRMNDYFDNTEIIYAKDYLADYTSMKKYQKKQLPLGYVEIDQFIPIGTPIMIRTLEGDLDLVVDGNFYIMIGIKGDVYPIRKERFHSSYRHLDMKHEVNAEYPPTIRNQITGKTESIISYAKACVSTGKTYIYAKELSLQTKVFTAWDLEKYMLGKPGDFIAVRCDDEQDVYIVERDIFFKSYDEIV